MTPGFDILESSNDEETEMTDLSKFLNTSQLAFPTIDLRVDPSITNPDDFETFSVVTVYRNSTNNRFYFIVNDFDWQFVSPTVISETALIDDFESIRTLLSNPNPSNIPFVELDLSTVDISDFAPFMNYLINNPFD